MASSPLVQVADASFDASGVSIATATRSSANSRFGTIYDNTILAAGAPVHVHTITPTQFLVAFSRRWTGATPSGSTPGHYSGYTEDLTPSWFLAGTTGARTLIDNSSAIPIRTPVDSATLVDGTSRAPDFVFILHSVTTGGVTNGLAQHFRIATAGRIVPVAEEVVPNLDDQGVTFDKGVAFTGSYLTVFGTDSDGHVFMARKPWTGLGVSGYTSNQRADGSLAWQFSTANGWDVNPANGSPEPGLLSAGPVSYARWRRNHYLATVQAQSDDRVAQIYSQFPSRPWTPMGSTVPLGSVADGSYLGGTLQLQSNLLVPPDLINTPGSETAFPFVTTTKTSADSEDALQVTWNALQIPRQT